MRCPASSSASPSGTRLVRDRHLGAELLRLVVGARHQRHAGDAGREAEIVLDARRTRRPVRRRRGSRARSPRGLPTRRTPRPRGRPGRRRRSRRRRASPDRSGAPGRCSAPARSRSGCAAACRSGRARSADGAGSTWKRSTRVCAQASPSGSSAGAAGRCGRGSPAAGARRRRRRAPTMSGPPTPLSSRPTRRRISARMMRSPRSASATIRSRSRCDGMTMRLDRLDRLRRRPARAGRTAGRARPESARTVRDDGLGKAVLRHLDPSRGDDDQAGRYAAGSHDIVARLIGSGSPNRRIRPRSAGVSVGNIWSRRPAREAPAICVMAAHRSFEWPRFEVPSTTSCTCSACL